MKIIGRIFKITAEISHKRIIKKNIDYKNQLLVLRNLLSAAKHTQFGFFHNFIKILARPDVVTQYQTIVPIADYDEFYNKWLHKTIAGQKDTTWKGKIKYYALSSGTTGSPSKRIPVSIQMIRSFQKTTLMQFSVLHELALDDSFFDASMLAFGGTTKLIRTGKHIEGDLSGILKKHASVLIKPFTKPGAKIAAIKDWNEKIDAIVEKAPQWNIGLIAGIPSWCLILLERIISHYQLKDIHDIWPNFQVYVHGGVYMGPYEDRFKKICGRKVFLLDTYLASEGYFAYQTDSKKPSMKLLLNSNIFYEFVPFNSNYFNEEGELISKHNAITISEVKLGIDYALVISSNAGLWRYLLGDLVRFTNISEKEIIITGRIKQFLSLCGEHLSLDNIYSALKNIKKKGLMEEAEFTISVDLIKQYHHYFIESNKLHPDANQLIKLIDTELCKINDDYKSARKYTLKSPQITIIPEGTIYQFMAYRGKLGGQNKMPCILNEEQKHDWLAFLREKELQFSPRE